MNKRDYRVCVSSYMASNQILFINNNLQGFEADSVRFMID